MVFTRREPPRFELKGKLPWTLRQEVEWDLILQDCRQRNVRPDYSSLPPLFRVYESRFLRFSHRIKYERHLKMSIFKHPIPYAGNRVMRAPTDDTPFPCCPDEKGNLDPSINEIYQILAHELRRGLKFYVQFDSSSIWLSGEVLLKLDHQKPLEKYLSLLMEKSPRSLGYLMNKWPPGLPFHMPVRSSQNDSKIN